MEVVMTIAVGFDDDIRVGERGRDGVAVRGYLGPLRDVPIPVGLVEADALPEASGNLEYLHHHRLARLKRGAGRRVSRGEHAPWT